MEDVEKRVQLVLEDVLDIAPGRIGGETAREDVPEWDSLAHLRLVTALEEEFGVRFTMTEIAELRSVADIIQYLKAV
jgi:Acyl carrier protein